MSDSRVGRRPGDSGTRELIGAVARAQFAEHGYARTTFRTIARGAGVDPALVTHYFGTKQRLFAAVVELPYDVEAALPAVLAGDPASVGERFARAVVGILESDAQTRFVGLVRAAATEPEAAQVVRELITTRVFAPVTAQLGVADAQLRACLLGSQVVGLVMARYVVGVEPLAGLGRDDLARVLAPTFQRYLTGELGSLQGP